MDKATLVARLIVMTGDLSPVEESTCEDLELARVTVAQALAAEQVEPAAWHEARGGRPPVADPRGRSGDEQSRLVRLVEEMPDLFARDPGFRVHRREFPVLTARDPGSLPAWAAGRAAERSLGPFQDRLGRRVWFDIFRIGHGIRLVRNAGASPFLILPLVGPVFSGSRFTIHAGSIWLAASELTSAAPAGGYIGLRISGGELTLSSFVTATGPEIVLSPAITCTVEVGLDPPLAPTGTGPGEDARRSTVDVPANATFVFRGAGAALTSAADARLEVYGTTVQLTREPAPPEFEPEHHRLFFPFRADLARFTVRDRQSTLFHPEGTAAVRSGAWALPVAVAAPASLGEASGAGALALRLEDGLRVTWAGQPRALTLGPATVIVDPGQMLVVAEAARGLGARQEVGLWGASPGAASSSTLEMSWPHLFRLRFVAERASEFLFAFGSLVANLDRPLLVDAARVPVVADEAQLVLFQRQPDRTEVFVYAALEPPASGRKALAFALANAVLKTGPAREIVVSGSLEGQRVLQGTVTLRFSFQYLLPILPDPYASNHGLAWRRLGETIDLGPLVARVDWTPTAPARLRFDLPPDAGALTAPAPRPESGDEGFFSDDPNLAAAVFEGLVLLDVSTHADQFGIGYGSRPREHIGPLDDVKAEEMWLLGRPTILTVPAVQWEPVSTPEQRPPPSPQFPGRLTFANNGIPTTIAVQTAHLVPMAPRPALDALVAHFGDGAGARVARAVFTLPFGIVAVAHLKKDGDDPTSRRAEIGYNRPRFRAHALEGGHQLSIRALDPSSPAERTPSFEGWALQLRNGLSNGQPSGKSVLDVAVDAAFNGYVGPYGLRPQLPVTRLDLSGYGESLFSDWRNPTDDPVAVSQVRFDVLVGRTAFEVVQVRSILYPYAVRVVRTITIERRNDGRVARRDSGWQAASDGEYAYPAAAALVTHPGVVRRIRSVGDIRDTGQVLTIDGVDLAAVLFDGDLEIEGTTRGGTISGVPARGQLGFVQLTPTGAGAITPATYRKLLAAAGPLGGTVDCVIDIGASGQAMRVGRVGVGATQGGGGPEFVMAAWGSPAFPRGGQWAFLRQTAPGDAPSPVDRDLGVPLIRAGPAPAAPPPSSPYRFADPADLATPDAPAADYGIIHATGTQRVFFPRPRIEAGARHITSSRIPVLADPYALSTAVGLFPRLSDGIAFPDSNWALAIAADGNYRLELPGPSFPVTMGERTLSDGHSVRGYVDYAGARVELSLDTAAPVPWAFRLRDVSLATSSGGLGEVVRVRGTVEATADSSTRLRDTSIAFGGVLQPVQDILVFLQHLGGNALPPLSVSMTNAANLEMALKAPLDRLFDLIPLPEGLELDDTELSVTLKNKGGKQGETDVEFEFDANLLIRTQFPFVKAVGRVELKVALSTKTGRTFVFTLGAGAGVFSKNPFFELKLYVVRTIFVIVGSDSWGLGTGLIGKGSIDFGWVGLELTLEAKLAIVKVTCLSEYTIWLAGVLTIAVEITVAFVVDIGIELELGLEENLIGPSSCELPDVV